MVCAKCEKKLPRLAAPDPSAPGASRQIGKNTLISGAHRPSGSSSAMRSSPYGVKCKDCKGPVTQTRGTRCGQCAYKKGVCAMCGKKVLDTKGYAMSSK